MKTVGELQEENRKNGTRLTPEEKREFNALNYMAFAGLREAAGKDHIACWLCTSPEIRKAEREKGIAKIKAALKANGNWLADTMTDRGLEDQLMALPSVRKQVETWQNVELDLKRERDEEMNPRAFFVPGQNAV